MDLTGLKWIKNVTHQDSDIQWAYQCSKGRVELELNWSVGSEENANKPRKGELILLKQKGRITHLVEVADHKVKQGQNLSNKYNPYRLVEIVWVTRDWNNPPTVEEIFQHQVNLQSGYVILLENIEAFQQYWNQGRGGLIGFQNHLQSLLLDLENSVSFLKKTEITVQYIFDLFNYYLPQQHQVKPKVQEKWRKSPEGWEHHALTHLRYWTLRDFKGFTNKQCFKELPKTNEELLEEAMTGLFMALADYRNTLKNSQAEAVNL